MSRNPEYQFVSTDAGELETQLVAAYEQLTGTTAHPASPERLFIQWVAAIILHERVLNNYTGNQNVPSRASGENLDALGDLFYDKARPDPTAATCTMRFYISEPQTSAILIPAGTRVTDTDNTLVWETTKDAYVAVGDIYADVLVRCQTEGTPGNGYTAGQISALVDVYDYYSTCANITTSDGGSDSPTDSEYYDLLRASMDGYSTAGGEGNYVYHAKLASSEIGDVIANSPMPGEVRLYILMDDGTLATEEVKRLVLEACNADTVRPLTDHVQTEDPKTVSYDIDFTYWIASGVTGVTEIQEKVATAVEEYVKWQSSKLGLDINPSHLYGLLMQTGVKRVELRKPAFTPLRGGTLTLGVEYAYEDTIPEVAAVDGISIVNGGYEDE